MQLDGALEVHCGPIAYAAPVSSPGSGTCSAPLLPDQDHDGEFFTVQFSTFVRVPLSVGVRVVNKAVETERNNGSAWREAECGRDDKKRIIKATRL